MADSKPLGLLKIGCEMLDQQQRGRKCNSQTERHLMHQRTEQTVNTPSVGVTSNCTNMPDYFRSSSNREVDKGACKILTKKIHNDFSDVFTGIGWCNGTIKLQVREGSHPHQAPSRRVSYAL